MEERNGAPRDRILQTGGRDPDALVGQAGEMALHAVVPPTIGTKGFFLMMELPSELRLEIYRYLLVCPEPIIIDSLRRGPSSTPTLYDNPPHPSVAILHTCKTINAEGTPILYSQNQFIICLSMEPGPSLSLANSSIIRSLRWSTLSYLTSISFVSNTNSNSSSVSDQDPTPRIVGPHSRPSFTCTGADILARFASSDFRYSPAGPDQYMALSISNWVSMQVMRAELSAFQRDLEAMMRPSDALLGLFPDDPVS